MLPFESRKGILRLFVVTLKAMLLKRLMPNALKKVTLHRAVKRQPAYKLLVRT